MEENIILYETVFHLLKVQDWIIKYCGAPEESFKIMQDENDSKAIFLQWHDFPAPYHRFIYDTDDNRYTVTKTIGAYQLQIYGSFDFNGLVDVIEGWLYGSTNLDALLDKMDDRFLDVHESDIAAAVKNIRKGRITVQDKGDEEIQSARFLDFAFLIDEIRKDHEQPPHED